MKKSSFKPVSAKTDFKLPSDESSLSLNQWLDKLPATEEYSTCNQIFNALQSINSQVQDKGRKYEMLQSLYHYLEKFSGELEKKIIDASIPLTSTEKYYGELIVWTYAELAKGFSQCIDSAPNISSVDRCAQTLFYALQSLGHTLLHISEAYEQPYANFWISCYELYSLAEQLDILDQEVSQNDFEQGTINNAFKRILIFQLCGIEQYRPREIKTIYNFLAKFVHHAVITNAFVEQYANYYSKFDLQENIPPQILKNYPEKPQDNTRYLITLETANNIHRFLQNKPLGTGALASINEALYLRLIKTLGVPYKRKYTRIKENKLEYGIIGFDNVLHYLRKNGSEKNGNDSRVKKFDPRVAGSWSLTDLELLPLGDEQPQRMTESRKFEINQNEKIKKIVAASDLTAKNKIWKLDNLKLAEEEILQGEFEILNSSIQGYGLQLGEGLDIKARVGDILGILSDAGTRVELGIICRINKPNIDRIKFGVELISLETQAIRMCIPGQTDTSTWAMFLPGIKSLKQANSIIFKSGDFTTGELICMNKGTEKINCRLQKLLHATPAISHLELYYQDETQ